MEPFIKLAERLGDVLCVRGLCVSVAESCTGGLISSAITSVAGSSQWFKQSYVTYSNEAKTQMLGVSAQLIAEHGAVSEAVVCQMAAQALACSGAHIAVAVSGIAGPTGAQADKPVGTVWIAFARTGHMPEARLFHLPGKRAEVRYAATQLALLGLIARSLYENYASVSAKMLQEASTMKRLFFGIWPSASEQQTTHQFVASLPAMPNPADLMHQEDYHLTLSFLGEMDGISAAAMSKCVEAISFKPFAIVFDKLSYFSNAHTLVLEPSVIPEPLLALIKDLTNILYSFGWKKQGRAYSPHVSLIKRLVKETIPLSVPHITWQCTCFVLAQSIVQAHGARYKVVRYFPESFDNH